MKFFILLTSLIVFIDSASLAQENTKNKKGNLQGHIVYESLDAAPGVSVKLDPLGKGTSTDDDGNFYFSQLPEGIYTLTVSAIGSNATRQNISVEAGKTLTLTLKISSTSTQLQDVTIITKSNYLKRESSIAFRTNDAIREIPLSIQTVSSALIKSQGATSYDQIIKNLSGVVRNTPYQRYTHRGFVSYNNFIVNGMKTVAYVSFNQQPSLFNVESVENLKGPASALFGDNEPGGIINFNLKKPLFTKRFEADVFSGTWSTFGGMLDYTAPISTKVAYRIVGGYERTNSFRRPEKGHNYIVTPSVIFKLSDRSSLSADFTYQKQKSGYAYDRGIIAYRRSDGSYDTDKLPLSWTATSKDDHTINDGYSAGVSFKHKFSDKLNLISSVRTSMVNTDNEGHEQYYGYPVFGTPDSVNRYYNIYKLKETDINWVTFINYRFKTGKAIHTFSPGVDIRNYKSDNIYLEHDIVPAIRLDNPDYSLDNPGSYMDSSSYENSKYNTFTYAFYVQHQINLADKWKFSASIRYQNYQYIAKPGIKSISNNLQSPDSSTADAWLPRLGIVYLPNKIVAIYANYATSFVPQYSNYRVYGGPFEPETGQQIEAGTKVSLNNKKLFTTIAVFQIVKENILYTDPNDPSGATFIQTGKARSRGIEISITGEVCKNLDIVANYAYTNAVFMENSDVGDKGTSLPSAPRNIANIWLTYSKNIKHNNRLSLSAGMEYVDKRLAINSSGFEVPSYVVADLAIQYNVNRIGFRININNLFDKRYFYGAQNAARLFPGDPINLRIGINYLLTK